MWRDVMLLSYVGGNSELWGMLGLWDRYFGPWGSPALKRRRLSTETFLQRFNGDICIYIYYFAKFYTLKSREFLKLRYIYIYECKVGTKAKTL